MSGTVARENSGKIRDGTGRDGTTQYYSGKVLNGLEMNSNPRLFLKFDTEQLPAGLGREISRIFPGKIRFPENGIRERRPLVFGSLV